MIKLSAHLDMLFNEVDFLERFQRAAKAGFKGVEFRPYSWDKEILREKLEKYGLIQVQQSLPMGNTKAGDKGLATYPERIGEFRDSVGTAIEFAKTLKCSQMNCPIGFIPKGINPDLIRETVVNNLRFAAEALSKEGLRLLIEPLDIFNEPGFFLVNTNDAVQLIRDVNHSNLFILYDTYHAQLAEGNLTNTILANINLIGHIHIGDCPGRSEPGTGEINFDHLLKSIDDAGYDGWIGCEYIPTTVTKTSFGWAKRFLGNK